MLIHFCSIGKQVLFANVNHAQIRSWNQPVLSNEGSFLFKETTGDLIWWGSNSRSTDWLDLGLYFI